MIHGPLPDNAPSAPGETVYLSGSFIPADDAALSVEDRGTLFGDGVYEVVRYYKGRPLAMAEHVARLRRSLDAIRLAAPAELDQLPDISARILQHNRLQDAKVYWQVTRGAAPRAYPFPAGVQPSVLVTASPQDPLVSHAPPVELHAVLLDDLRWMCCHIKAITLLPNMLAHNRAIDAGADIAILHRDGRVTETPNANVLAVIGGVLRTHPADHWILHGVTRGIVLDLARKLGIPVREEPVTTQTLLAAEEIMVTGTTTHLAAVTNVDGQPIGGGGVGPLTARLHRAFIDHIRSTCNLA